MEVNILISSPIDTVVSPVSLARAIGIPPGGKLRLCRDPTDSGQSRLIAHCDRRTASDLRHRFSTLSPYAHNGHLTSLKTVGIKPIFPRREQHRGESLPRGFRDGPGIPAKKAKEGSGTSAELSQIGLSTGVERALDVVGVEADDLLRDVPGVAELYEEFLVASTRAELHPSWKTRHTRMTQARSSDGEGKQGGSATVEGDSDTSTLSEEMKGDSSSGGSRSRAGHQCIPSRQRRHRRSQRYRKNARRKDRQGEDIKHNKEAVAEHQRRWHLRHVLACVEDVALALTRISRDYSEAPKPASGKRIVSMLAKLYADGTAFADNSRRAYETLERLGVVRWHAKALPQAASWEKSRGNAITWQLEPRRTAAEGNWFRLLRRVTGLVGGIVDFGVFVQVYVAAAEGARPVASSRTSCTEEGRMANTESGEVFHGGGGSGSGKARRRQGRERSLLLPERPHAGVASEGEKKQGEKNVSGGDKTPPPPLRSPPASDPVLPWLFPPREGGAGGAREAFNRHVVCGGAVHGLITMESAAVIVRDAGKVLRAEQVWRYWHCRERVVTSDESGGDRAGADPLARGRYLLGFQDFVDMCEGLKSHVTNASIIEQPQEACAATS